MTDNESESASRSIMDSRELSTLYIIYLYYRVTVTTTINGTERWRREDQLEAGNWILISAYTRPASPSGFRTSTGRELEQATKDI